MTAPPFDIDVVFTFIDGNDPKLVELKSQAIQRQNKTKKIGVAGKRAQLPINSATPMRWRQWGEIEQSVQSILAFAPWVKSIHVVSPNAKPKWFETLSSKPLVTGPSASGAGSTVADLKSTTLHWVPELELIESKEPLFNSHVAESVLHKIPGLAEHFVYFCDDMFVGAPVTYLDWFSPDGKPRLHVKTKVAESKSGKRNIKISNSPFRNMPLKYSFAWQGALATANQLLDKLAVDLKINSTPGASQIFTPFKVAQQQQKNMKKKPEFYEIRVELQHCCAPLTKQGYLDVWKHPLTKQTLEQTRQSLFRKCTDVHTVYLVSCYLLMTQRAEFYGCHHLNTTNKAAAAEQEKIEKPNFYYTELSSIEKSLRILKAVPHKFYCLNDACDFNHPAQIQMIKRAIATELPHAKR